MEVFWMENSNNLTWANSKRHYLHDSIKKDKLIDWNVFSIICIGKVGIDELLLHQVTF